MEETEEYGYRELAGEVFSPVCKTKSGGGHDECTWLIHRFVHAYLIHGGQKIMS